MRLFLLFLITTLQVKAAILSPQSYEVKSLRESTLFIELTPLTKLPAIVYISDFKTRALLQKVELKEHKANINLNKNVINFKAGWLNLSLNPAQDAEESIIFGRGYLFLTAGQSNTTNSHKIMLERSKASLVSVLNENRKFELLERKPEGDIVPIVNDSLLSSFIGRSSVWPYVGDELSKKLGVPVLFINIGHSGSSINQWTKFLSRPRQVALKNNFTYGVGFKIDAILWHQGEADSNKLSFYKDQDHLMRKYKQYKSDLTSLITYTRKKYLTKNLPWLVSVTSRICKWPGEDDTEKHSQIIERAQKEIQRQIPYVYKGPNTNLIEHSCHFDTTHSLREYKSAWVSSILNFINTIDSAEQ